MNAREALAKLVVVERERDSLREVNCKLRDKLLEIAKECSGCAGKGVVTVIYEVRGKEKTRVQDCGDCLDIRAVLE